MDNIEIEFKSRADDIDNIRKALREMGAEFLEKCREEDIYYSHPCRDFASTDEALRIRVTGGSSEITYKGPKIDAVSKSREEYGTVIEDYTSMSKILKKLGFETAGKVVKERETYLFEGIKISVDIVENLGNFVEVETLSDREHYAENFKRCMGVCEVLGMKEFIRESYLEMLVATNHGGIFSNKM